MGYPDKALNEEMRAYLKSTERYADFEIVDEPERFNKFFANENFDVVQVHDVAPIEIDGKIGVCGFAGQFSWIDGVLKPLDGDCYNKETLVLGYDKFETEDGKHCIDIMVAEDW